MSMFLQRKKTEQASSDSAMSPMSSKYGVLSVFSMKCLTGFSKLCVWNSLRTVTYRLFLFYLLSITQIPLEICEWGSVCFHRSKYSHLLTHVASLTVFHYYFGNSCMKTQPSLSVPLSLVDDIHHGFPVSIHCGPLLLKNKTGSFAFL